MNRTDTVLLPRIVATASAPLERPALTLVATRRRWLALLLLTLAVGASLAVVAGRAVAWHPASPVVEQTGPAVLPLELPCCHELAGTDAGLITEPAR